MPDTTDGVNTSFRVGDPVNAPSVLGSRPAVVVATIEGEFGELFVVEIVYDGTVSTFRANQLRHREPTTVELRHKLEVDTLRWLHAEAEWRLNATDGAAPRHEPGEPAARGSAHYRAAETLALSLRSIGEHAFHEEAPIALAEAQVHATLAVADMLREVGDQLDVLPSSLGRAVRSVRAAL